MFTPVEQNKTTLGVISTNAAGVIGDEEITKREKERRERRIANQNRERITHGQ